MYSKSMILLNFSYSFGLPSFSAYVYKNTYFVFVMLMLFIYAVQ